MKETAPGHECNDGNVAMNGEVPDRRSPDPLPHGLLSSRVRLMKAALGIALAMGIGSVAVLQPLRDLLPVCLFHELTGLSCLTCGLTRSMEAVSHGDLLAAMQYHLMGPFLLAGMFVACAAFVGEALTGRRWVGHVAGRGQRYGLALAGASWLTYGVVRAILELL